MLDGLFINSSSVTGTPIRLNNNQFLRSRNAADTGDINVLKVNSSNQIEFSIVPIVTGLGALALLSDITDYSAAIATLQGEVAGLQSDIAAVQGQIVIIETDITSIEESIGFLQSDVNILNTSVNTLVNDVNALEALQSLYVLLDGTRAMTGALNLGNHKIINVTNPTLPQDAATKAYVDAAASDISALEARVTALETDVSTLQLDVGVLNTDVSSLQAQILSLNVTVSDLQDEDLTFLKIDGSRAMTGILDLGSHKIINVVDPTDPQDVATKAYVDASGPGAYTASNLGAGEIVYAQQVANDFQFKTLVAGTNIALVSDADTITINSSDVPVADATTTSKGIIQLAGDLDGTADAPTVPGLANKVDITGDSVTGVYTFNSTSLPVDFTAISMSITSDNASFENSGTRSITVNSTPFLQSDSASLRALYGLSFSYSLFDPANPNPTYPYKSDAVMSISGQGFNFVSTEYNSLGEGNQYQANFSQDGNFSLQKNSDPFLATQDKHIATKKYVDTAISSGSTTASNIGAGTGVFAQKISSDLQFKSLVAGTNVSLASDATTITINATGTGIAGVSVLSYDTQVLADATILSFGNGLQVASDAVPGRVNIDLTDTPPIGWLANGVNVGSGTGIFKEDFNNTLYFKSIVGGAGIALFEFEDTITIESTIGPADINVYKDGVPVVTTSEINFVGSNITVNNVAGVAEISVSSGGGTAVDYIQFNLTPVSVPADPGTLFWDQADGNQTLSLNMAGGNVVQQIGEEEYVRIKATAPIIQGQSVMITGTVGTSGAYEGQPAQGVTDGHVILGVATEDIAFNDYGYVTCMGLVRNIVTDGSPYLEIWNDGDDLYWNPDPLYPGGLTNVKPSAPNVKAAIGSVVKASGGMSGSIYVRLNPGSELGGTDSNVEFGPLDNNDFIVYDSGLGYWKNITLAETQALIGGGGAVPDATTTSKGIIQLAGDLSGTADAPNVPGLTTKINKTGDTVSGTYTFQGSLTPPFTFMRSKIISDEARILLENSNGLENKTTDAYPGAIYLTYDYNIGSTVDFASNTMTVSSSLGFAFNYDTIVAGVAKSGAITFNSAGSSIEFNGSAYIATQPQNITTKKYVDDALLLKANIASPTFTGTPAAPTATAGTNTTQIATTAFVTSAIAAIPAPTVANATTTTNGIVRLAGDLGGTANAPTVPNMIKKNTSNAATGCSIAFQPTSTPSGYAASSVTVNYAGCDPYQSKILGTWYDPFLETDLNITEDYSSYYRAEDGIRLLSNYSNPDPDNQITKFNQTQITSSSFNMSVYETDGATYDNQFIVNFSLAGFSLYKNSSPYIATSSENITTKSYVDSAISSSLSGYATQTYVNTAIANATFIPTDTLYSKRSIVPVSGSTTLFSNGMGASGTNWSIVSGTAGSTTPTNAGARSRAIRSRLSSSGSSSTSCSIGSNITNPICSMTFGWKLVLSFGYGDGSYNASTRSFYGLIEGGVPTIAQPSALLNMIGIGNDATPDGVTKDTNLQIMHNDGAGTATKIDLGVNFPANRTSAAVSQDWIVLELYNAPGTSTVKYKVTNLLNAAVTQGTLTTNLPAASAMLAPTLNRANGTISTIYVLEFGEIAVWTNG